MESATLNTTKKIVHMTSVHRPFDTRIFHRECKSLKATGHEVVLIAPHEKDEVADGITIRGVTRPRNRFQRMFQTVWHVYRRATEERGCVYHFHDPELIPVGILLKLRGRRIVYDVHEDVPADILDKEWIPPFIRKPLAFLMYVLHKFCTYVFDAIVVATPTIKNGFSNRKTVLVQNFPPISELVVEDDTKYAARPLRVAYIGGISIPRGAKEMVLAMEYVRDHDARLILAGRFDPPQLQHSLELLQGWRWVDYVGWQSREGVRNVLASSRLGLAVLKAKANYLNSQATKLYEYLSAGLPVVVSNFPRWVDFVQTVQCGLTVDPDDPEAIAEAITWMLNHPDQAEQMGRNGRRAVMEIYNWERESEKLLEMYHRLLSG